MALRLEDCVRPRRYQRAAVGTIWVLVSIVSALPAFMASAARAQAASAASGTAGTSAAASSPPAQPPEALTPATAVAAMKSDLLRLVSANEVYFAKHTWYSDNIRALPGYKPTPGIEITIISADADGWNARATSTLLPGKSCVVYIGPAKPLPKTDADGRSGSEAVPVCDNVAARR